VRRKAHDEQAALNASLKRKRTEVDEADPKLKEFLDVMQPKSKANNWAAQNTDDDFNEPPTKMQALELPEADSDEEYETVPKKPGQKSPSKPVVLAQPIPVQVPVPVPVSVPAPEPLAPGEDVAPPLAADATDDDWLRSRTNRLLDLMDPEEITAGPVNTTSKDVAIVAGNAETGDPDIPVVEDVPEKEKTEQDRTLEAISANGRLFVRNLPYSASEEELRKHFEPFGSLEEVRINFLRFLPFACFHDEYPDRDSLYFQVCDVNWTKILVDASCFLNSLRGNFMRKNRKNQA
jgi:multiple RNA-binding domain-containing protein 1